MSKRAKLKTHGGDETWKVGWKKLRDDWAHVDWKAKEIWFDPRYTSLLELIGFISHEAMHVSHGLTQEHAWIDRTEHNVVAICAALGILKEDE